MTSLHSCPMCKGRIKRRIGIFNTCAICRKTSISLMKASPVPDAEAKANYAVWQASFQEKLKYPIYPQKEQLEPDVEPEAYLNEFTTEPENIIDFSKLAGVIE